MQKFLYRKLAKAANGVAVNPGQEVILDVDLALAHDGTGPELLKHWGNDKSRPVACRKVLFTLDHAFPAPSIKDRQFHKEFTEFSLELGCHLYNQGEGVLHQVVAEEESIWPGMIIVGADGHVATAGAFGAIAFAVTPQELVPVLENGTFTTRVPEQLTIAINGELSGHALPRDAALYLISKLSAVIKGKAVALTGSLFSKLSLAGKMSICNFLPEGGVKTAFILPEGESDEVDYYLEAAEIEPLIALPPNINTIMPVREAAGVALSMAIAGGCSAGRLEDMKVIAHTLKGKKINPQVTFVVAPASRKILDAMESLGLTGQIRDAGAVIVPPGCGSCPGKHFGLLDEKDVAVTTTIRNTPGRIGSVDAQIYLASPLTVALSAIHGQIAAPQ
ncbi:MAG: aconitase family protein [Desulfitobacteriia bacterium]|jgi:3-isopropylmalate/(R)-2-methylmalate dehydratase large subunit